MCADRKSSSRNDTAAARPPHGETQKAEARSPLEVVFEAVEERARPTTMASFTCIGRALNAIAILHGDKDNTSIAIEAIASVSMRVVGDAQAITKLFADGRIKNLGVLLVVMHELSNMATIFARSQAFEDIYDSVCVAIRELSFVLNGGQHAEVF
jgi:hypothetical protein